MRTLWARVVDLFRQSRAISDQGRQAREAAHDRAAADELGLAREHLTERPGGWV